MKKVVRFTAAVTVITGLIQGFLIRLNVIVIKLVADQLKFLLIKWIYNINVLFSVVKYLTFCKLLALLNLTVMVKALLKLHITIRKWISELYSVKKVVLRKKITAYN